MARAAVREAHFGLIVLDLRPSARIALVAGLLLAAIDGAAQPRCPMQPARLSMTIPESGFLELAPSGPPERCALPQAGRWIRGAAGPVGLFVHADGPSGSGRFWRVTVGIGASGAAAPERGFCLETSTEGWRTLRRFGRTPLPWLLDLDADGIPELIVWESFPLAQGAVSQSGLVAWAYRFEPQGAFAHDGRLTRSLARELAAAYRVPIEANHRSLARARTEAARALEALGDAMCTLVAGPFAPSR